MTNKPDIKADRATVKATRCDVRTNAASEAVSINATAPKYAPQNATATLSIAAT